MIDDNFARNLAWERIWDRLIHLRQEEDIQFKVTIQVDTVSHNIPPGVDRVFIGLESKNPESLGGSRKL